VFLIALFIESPTTTTVSIAIKHKLKVTFHFAERTTTAIHTR